MKAAVHIKTAGFYCGACPKVVEKALGSTEGVLDVVAVRSLGLTSVLYDEDRIDRETLCERIRRSGFVAEVVDPVRASEPRPDQASDYDGGSSS